MAEPTYYDELKKSLEEAAAYKNGDKTRVRVNVREIPMPEYQPRDIARIRSELKLSQRSFASVLGVSSRTVEAWEAGRNVPSQTACRLIFLIEKDRSLISQLVSGLSL